MAKATDTDESLKRLGGGRWQTRDERFTIEPQSGTWVVVDGEQTDDLGLALVRGPFGSLTAAKTAIAYAREAEPAESPLAARVATKPDRPTTAPAGPQNRPPQGTAAAGKIMTRDTKPAPSKRRPEAETPTEPRWLRELDPPERRRATRLIDRLMLAGATDAESIARRDLVGAVPAAAAFAVLRALAALGEDAAPASVARLLADGRDDDLGVRWRLVDGDDRPITLALDRARRR